MTALAAWVAFPLLALLVCLGTGLLAERLAGVPLPEALVPPLGFAAATCLVGFGFVLDTGIWPALVLLGGATAAGLWLSRADVISRFRPRGGAAAGAAAYLFYLTPVAFTGTATFLGYNLLNDTAVHFTLVDYVTEFGRADPGSLPESSFKSAAIGYVGLNYPLGSHELLATLRWPFGIDVVHVYQPYLAFAVGITASAIAGALRRAGALPAAAAAVVALSSQLLFSFNLQGGIKELTFLACVATAAGLGAELLRGNGRAVRTTALVAVPLAAGYAIYSWAALAWIAPFALALLALALVWGGAELRGRLLPMAGAGALCFVAAALPTLVGSIDFADKSQDVLTAGDEVGPLVSKLRKLQLAGIWLNGDYRFVPEEIGLNRGLAALVLALCAAGVAFAVRRKAAAPLLLAGSAVVAWLLVAAKGSPYAESKSMAVLSPAVVLLACLGVAGLWQLRALRIPVAVAAAVVVAALAFSDARAYREAHLAPTDRLDELGDAGERFAGQGPMLLNEFEEYAKHFARDAQVNSPYEVWTPKPAKLRPPGGPRFEHSYDLDQLDFGYVEQWPLIAQRRSPAASRPPANYELAWTGQWYEVWRRQGDAPAAHQPLGDPPLLPAARPSCANVGREATAYRRPLPALADLPSSSPLPGGWSRDEGNPPTLVTRHGGTVRAPVTTRGGRFRLWVYGLLVRESELFVDGRKVGDAEHVNGPNQWIEVGTLSLSAGRHTVELRRPGGSLAPGDKGMDRIGPAALEPGGGARLETAAGREACGQTLDWLERPQP